MIGLVGVLPPPGDGAGTVCLDALPDPPGSRFSGFAVRCTDRDGVREALGWYRTVRAARPALAFGLVCEPGACAEELAGLPHPLTFLIRPGSLVAAGLSTEALGQLREAGVEGRIFDEVVERYGEEVLREEETVAALIAWACCGGTVAGTASDLGVASFTVTRRLAAVGISAECLRSWTRLRAYDIRLELGVDPSDALRASGWTSQNARRKAALRLRKRGGC